MKVYSPGEVAELLKIKIPTLRKYSILLENKSYKISRNSQNHRYYSDDDIITLRRVITGSKAGVTLDESINNVLNLEGDNAYTNDANNALTEYSNDIEDIKEMMQEQTEYMDKQTELISKLSNQLDKQQAYIDDRLNKHDELLMRSLRESQETKKLLIVADENKPFFKKIFGKRK